MSQPLRGSTCDVLARVLHALVGKSIYTSKTFQSARKDAAIRCSVKANEGHCFPLEKSLLFLHKPVIYVRYSEIRAVSFARLGRKNRMSSRTFDNVCTQ